MNGKTVGNHLGHFCW